MSVGKWISRPFSFGNHLISVEEWLPPSPPRTTLIMTHGRLGDHRTWNPLFDKLRRDYRCLLVDLPGFGRSFSFAGSPFSFEAQAELIRQLADEWSPEGSVWMGHDWGGAISLGSLVLTRPRSRVHGLVLINSPCPLRALGKLPCGWPRMRLSWRVSQVLKRSPRLGTEYESMVRGCVTGCEQIHQWQEAWPGEETRSQWKERVSRLKTPVLLLWGAHDDLCPPEIGYEELRQLPESYFYEDETSGHWPQIENLPWVSGKLKDFLFKVVPEESSLSPARRSLSR